MRLCLLLLVLPFFLNGQNHQQFQFDGPAILIHGGAGGIERKYYTEEQIASYDSALRVVLQSGYGMLYEGANGMDVVVHCLTLLENDPHFNAGKTGRPYCVRLLVISEIMPLTEEVPTS